MDDVSKRAGWRWCQLHDDRWRLDGRILVIPQGQLSSGVKISGFASVCVTMRSTDSAKERKKTDLLVTDMPQDSPGEDAAKITARRFGKCKKESNANCTVRELVVC